MERYGNRGKGLVHDKCIIKRRSWVAFIDSCSFSWLLYGQLFDFMLFLL